MPRPSRSALCTRSRARLPVRHPMTRDRGKHREEHTHQGDGDKASRREKPALPGRHAWNKDAPVFHCAPVPFTRRMVSSWSSAPDGECTVHENRLRRPDFGRARIDRIARKRSDIDGPSLAIQITGECAGRKARAIGKASLHRAHCFDERNMLRDPSEPRRFPAMSEPMAAKQIAATASVTRISISVNPALRSRSSPAGCRSKGVGWNNLYSPRQPSDADFEAGARPRQENRAAAGHA